MAVLGSLLYSLQLQTGSFPKPLTREEEEKLLARSAQGDLEARITLVDNLDQFYQYSTIILSTIHERKEHLTVIATVRCFLR